MSSNKYNVLIFGTGNIGQRHLQSILNNRKIGRVYLYDKDKKILVNLIKKFRSKKIIFIKNKKNIFKKKYFLVILANFATNRSDILLKFWKIKNTKYILTEKLVENNIKNLKKMFYKIDENTYVNLNLRLVTVFKKIKELVKKEKKIRLNIKGNNWNMTSNAIHYLDFMKWITNFEIKEISILKLDRIFKSKRKSFVDFEGKIKCVYKNSSILTMENWYNLKKKKYVIMKLKSKNFNINYKIESDQISINGKVLATKYDHLSKTTNIFLNSALDNSKDIELPKLKDHVYDNLKYLKALKSKNKLLTNIT